MGNQCCLLAIVVCWFNVRHATACLPGSDVFQKVLGGNVKVVKQIKMVSTNAPSLLESARIDQPSQLACMDFTDTCRWRNINGLFVDEMDWYQGEGTADMLRMEQITQTNKVPRPPYAIAATSIKQLPMTKAVLASDSISCQQGDGELKFKYWTSPEVKIHVCYKRLSQTYPNYDYCSPSITSGDPGPAIVTIPGPINEPFELFIKAENFIFGSGGLFGGFAIMDDLQYNAVLCNPQNAGRGLLGVQSFLTREAFQPTDNTINALEDLWSAIGKCVLRQQRKLFRSPLGGGLSPGFVPKLPTRPINSLGTLNGHSFGGSRPSSVTSAAPTSRTVNRQNNNRFSTNENHVPRGGLERPFLPTIDQIDDDASVTIDACQLLKCDFASGRCLDFIVTSSWRVARGSVGNPLTGIRGDASQLPYNRDGSYAYAQGPSRKLRFATPSFSLPKDRNLMFSYYKASRSAGFRVYAKRRSESEQVIFQAPDVDRRARQWYAEARRLPAGEYDALIFEATNMKSNQFVGLDEIKFVDITGQPLC